MPYALIHDPIVFANWCEYSVKLTSYSCVSFESAGKAG
jgi:hypothetical protein